MEPVILVHGYSAESAQTTPQDIAAIYSSLPNDLAARGIPVGEINVSRYVSLDDGVDVDDISLAFDRAMRTKYPDLLENGFNAIIHSTGALVLRNWIRRFSDRPSPCKRIIHLAGANLGSGWAHIGESDLAKWLRFIGQGGAERGLAVLDGLELGSNWAIELHRYFLQPGNAMLSDYGTMEFSIVGSQVPPEWLVIPFRYGKEDGSDGVVRVSASNLNHNYVRVGPKTSLFDLDFDVARQFAQEAVEASAQGELADFSVDPCFAGGYYEVKEQSLPGIDGRPVVPFAIPYRCAHSTAEIGIVAGTATRADVLPLIQSALECTTLEQYTALVPNFQATTDATYARVLAGGNAPITGLKGVLALAANTITNYLHNPEAQYDRHAQVIIRVRDQNGKPVTGCSIHFNSFGGDNPPALLIDTLFQDNHVNNSSPDTTTFYLRLQAWDTNQHNWVDRLPEVNGVDLEIDSIDPTTQRIQFIPFRMRLSSDDLSRYVQPHQTTILDVVLLRLPSSDTFSLYPTPVPASGQG